MKNLTNKIIIMSVCGTHAETSKLFALHHTKLFLITPKTPKSRIRSQKWLFIVRCRRNKLIVGERGMSSKPLNESWRHAKEWTTRSSLPSALRHWTSGNFKRKRQLKYSFDRHTVSLDISHLARTTPDRQCYDQYVHTHTLIVHSRWPFRRKPLNHS